MIFTGCSQAKPVIFFPRSKGLVSYRWLGVEVGFGHDNTHDPYLCRRHHDRAVSGLWLASLHDGKRGTRQISQGASFVARQRALLE